MVNVFLPKSPMPLTPYFIWLEKLQFPPVSYALFGIFEVKGVWVSSVFLSRIWCNKVNVSITLHFVVSHLCIHCVFS